MSDPSDSARQVSTATFGTYNRDMFVLHLFLTGALIAFEAGPCFE